MELSKVQLARTVWLFDTQELNPKGVRLYPNIYNAFAKRYQFAVVPKPEEIQAGGSLYFKSGTFVYDSLSVEIDFDLHSDGLVATCRHSTEAAHDFLLDCTRWLGEQLGVAYPPHLMQKRVYKSELVVHMDARLTTLSQKLGQFSEMISTKSQRAIQPTGLLFGEDNGAISTLTIDRRINTPWEENRYYSTSSLPTTQHIEALAVFEQIMAE